MKYNFLTVITYITIARAYCWSVVGSVVISARELKNVPANKLSTLMSHSRDKCNSASCLFCHCQLQLQKRKNISKQCQKMLYKQE